MAQETRRRPRTWIGAALLGIASCNQLVEIHGGTLRDGTCATVADCEPDVDDCRVAAACTDGLCVFESATSAPDDGDPCTLDRCDGITPTHTKKTALPCYTGPAAARGKGVCVEGTQLCDEQGMPLGGCEGETFPRPETCASWLDDDCDGQANEEGPDCACTPGQMRACYTGPAGTPDVGPCHGGTQACNASATGFGECMGEMRPQPEGCTGDTIDDDCDGYVNDQGDDCACGDGSLSEGEECDDGGTSDGDACSPLCRVQKVTHLFAGIDHTCAILNDSRVKCWGNNESGQLGLGDITDRGNGLNEMGNNLQAIDLGTGATASALALGHLHTCALLNDNRVKCWGANFYGQLGLGDTINRGGEPNEMGDNLPSVDLGTGEAVSALVAGAYHTCALLNDGRVKCWGYNGNGQLGLGDTINRGDGFNQMGDKLPVIDLGMGKTVSALVAGAYHTCALLNDDRAKCWGYNESGQLGLGDTINRGNEPNQMGDNLPAIDFGAGKTASALVAGAFHTCALLNDDRAKCWGYNSFGQLGLGDTIHRGNGPNQMGDNLKAIDLGAGKTASALIARSFHTCALLNDDSAKCWGNNENGQLGLGTTVNRGNGPNQMGDNLKTINLGLDKTASALVTGDSHTCALLNDGSAKCWGHNDSGQLGLGDTTDRGDEPNEMGDNLPSVKLFSDLW